MLAEEIKPDWINISSEWKFGLQVADTYHFYTLTDDGGVLKILRMTLNSDQKVEDTKFIYSEKSAGPHAIYITQSIYTEDRVSLVLKNGTQSKILFINKGVVEETYSFASEYSVQKLSSTGMVLYHNNKRTMSWYSFIEKKVVKTLEPFVAFNVTDNHILIWRDKGFLFWSGRVLMIYDKELNLQGKVQGSAAKVFSKIEILNYLAPLSFCESPQMLVLKLNLKSLFKSATVLMAIDLRSFKVIYKSPLYKIPEDIKLIPLKISNNSVVCSFIKPYNSERKSVECGLILYSDNFSQADTLSTEKAAIISPLHEYSPGKYLLVGNTKANLIFYDYDPTNNKLQEINRITTDHDYTYNFSYINYVNGLFKSYVKATMVNRNTVTKPQNQRYILSVKI